MECIDICEKVFKPTHPNLIPNLMNFGGLLVLEQNWEEAGEIFRRALSIHKGAGRSGGVEVDIESFLKQVEEKRAHVGVGNELVGRLGTLGLSARSDVSNAGNFLLFTDPGRDLDDELTFALISSWCRDGSREERGLSKVAFLGVVASFGNTELRSKLCRGTLDVLAMGKVPVCVGQGEEGATNCSTDFADSYLPLNEWKPLDRKVMLKHIFENADDKSIDVALIAAMTDCAEFIEENPELFKSKVRSVNIMGGAVGIEGGRGGKFLTPDDSYNNFCDEVASELVFEKCQELGVPMTLLSR